MNKLPISIGILAWHSGQTLVDTLFSYHEQGLINIANDVTILFQECTEEDASIANHFGLNYIGLDSNIGIGKGFISLAQQAKADNILLLEHDWILVEDEPTTRERLNSGLELLDADYQVVKYRHRTNPGYPLFTQAPYQGRELEHYDSAIDLTSPHLLESIHWLENPHEMFSDKIEKLDEDYTTTSRWANWTNNPCLFRKQFYIDTVSQFSGEGIDLEGKIGWWWARQNFKVAHGEGLFMHRDLKKFGR